MNYQKKFVAFLYFTVLFAGFSSHAAYSANDEPSRWEVRGDGDVRANVATLDRLTGQLTSAEGNRRNKISITWPKAQLETDGMVLATIRMKLTLVAGPTMVVGADTEYPGLITKLYSADGEIEDISSGRVTIFQMSERGTWIAKFIHANSQGDDHLAAEIPFSLYDKRTRALLAQSNLVIAFNIATRAKPSVARTTIEETPFEDLRTAPTDIASAILGQSTSSNMLSSQSVDKYKATVNTTGSWAAQENKQAHDLFQAERLSYYNCETNETMLLELQSSGFESLGERNSPAFSLQLRYQPTLIAESDVTYLEGLQGQIKFKYDNAVRIIDVGPGNHGNVASSAMLTDDGVHLLLGVALREGASTPVVARLDVSCNIADMGQLACTEIEIATATDVAGRSVSPAPLSALLAKPYSYTEFQLGTAPGLITLGGVSCPFLCPTCRPTQCRQGSFCYEHGPIGCSAGCDHTPGSQGCCRSGGSKICCKNCGIPQ